MGRLITDFSRGLVNENPVFRLALGMCPVLAVTAAVENGFWMGLAVVFVLTMSNLIISLLRPVIPSRVRIPCFIVIIATFVTIVELTMQAFMPDMFRILGIFIPLIVVNCVILQRAEAFASKNPVVNSIADGLGMGIGFTLALMLIAAVRELLGTANIEFMGRALFGSGLGFPPALVMILPPGAFLTIGVLLGLINYLTNRGSRAQHAGR